MGAVDAHVSSNMFLCSSFYMETVRQWKNKGIKHFCNEIFSILIAVFMVMNVQLPIISFFSM